MDELLRLRAEHRAEHVVYRFHRTEEGRVEDLSAGELMERAGTMAAVLEDLGTPNRPVLLLFEAGLDFLVAFFGCMLSGSIAVPAPPPGPRVHRGQQTLRRLLSIVESADIEVLLTSRAVMDSLAAVRASNPPLAAARWVPVDELLECRPFPVRETAPDAPAYLQYTSGSTSAPKGVIITHRQALANSESIRTSWRYDPDSRSVMWVPNFHDDGLVHGLLQPLYTGYEGNLMAPASLVRSPVQWLRTITRVRATHSGGPNFVYEVACNKVTAEQMEGLDLSSWRMAYNGAEHVRPSTLRRFYDKFQPVGFAWTAHRPCYGMAEATLVVSGRCNDAGPVILTVRGPEFDQGRVVLTEADDDDAREVAGSGQPFFGMDVAIVCPDSGQRCDPDEIGEIWVTGGSVSEGYWQLPEVSLETFHAHLPGDERRFLRTGDLGFVRDSELFVTGRIKDLIIVHGVNHYPQDIELTVELGHETVRRGCCIAFSIDPEPGARREVGEQLVVVSELARGCWDRSDALLVEPQRVADAIRRAVVRDHGLELDRLVLVEPGGVPKTSSGKLQRRGCRAMLEAGELPVVADLALAQNPPRDDPPPTPSSKTQPGLLEGFLVELAEEAFDARGLRGHDVLIDLGLDSLRVMQLRALIEQSLGVPVTAAEIVEAKTLADLARLLGPRLLDGYRRRASGARDTALGALSLAPGVVTAPEQRLEPFVLNDIQRAYLLGRDADLPLGGVSCHAYMELEAIDLDPERLEAAWQALVRRHAMLRGRVEPDGERMRVSASEATPHIELVDLRGADALRAAAVLDRRRQSMAQACRNPSREAPWELAVSLLPGGRARVHLDFDLLMIDAASIFALGRELGLLYSGRDPGPPLGLDFRDYRLAEEGLGESAAYQRAKSYWQARLPNLPAAPDLPVLAEAQTRSGLAFVRRSHRLSRQAWSALRQLARQRGVTAVSLLCTAFSQVLARWSRAPRFCINLTLARRRPLHPDVRRLVGEFTSTLLLEVETVGESFGALANTLQLRLLSDLDHADYSGIEALRDLGRLRGSAAGRMPVVFTSLLGLDAHQTEPWAWLGEQVFGVSQTPQVWLDHQVEERNGELELRWDAAEELFPERLLDDMFAAYRQFLEWLSSEPDAWHRPVRIPLPPYQVQARLRANRTSGPRPEGLLQDGLLLHAEDRPQATAIVDAEGPLSYAELGLRSAEVALRLCRSGVRPGATVAVLLPRGRHQAIAVFGVLRSGAAYLPIEPALPDARIEELLIGSGTHRVITDSDNAARIREELGQALLLPEDLPSSAQLKEPVASTSELAYVIYTSGSTGRPKGVMIRHGAALNTLVDINERFAVGPADRVLGLSSIGFDLSVYDLFGLTAAGGTVVLPPANASRDPACWLQLLHAHEVTVWNTVPALLELLVEHVTTSAQQLPHSLRLVLLSGDWIPLGLPAALRSVAPRPDLQVISLGGATEASIWSIFHPIDEIHPSWSSIPYGRPLRNQRFYVLDRALQPCPDHVPGELFIAGDGLAEGYLADPQRTAERFFESPETGERLYRTGDLGRRGPDAVIEFLGREDDQVKVGGHRIELGEIGATLMAHPRVQQAVAAAVGPARGRRVLAAYVVPSDGSEDSSPTPGALTAWLAERLPRYMVPGTIVLLDSLPLTANGKVDRRSLPTPQELLQVHGDFVAPVTAVQRKLASLWCEVLGVERVGLRDSFFRLGGDSLTALRLATRVQNELHRHMPLPVVFDRPGLDAQADYLEDLAARAGEPAALLPRAHPQPASRYQPFALTDVQQAYWAGRGSYFELGEVGTHIYLEMERGDVTVEQLEQSWQRLCNQHEMLRAVVLEDGYQQILESVPSYRFPCRDLRALSPEEQHRLVVQTRNEMSHQRLDVERWPLFDIRASLLPGGRVRIHFSIDFIVTDGWSLLLLFRQWARLLDDPEAVIKPAGLSFRDYVITLEAVEQGPLFERAMRYWQERLPALPPAPELPLATDPGSMQHPHFVRRAGQLSAARWSALKRRAGTLGLTPSGLLMAAFSEVLARWSTQSEMTLNVTMFNRLPVHPNINDIVGDFTSLTLLAIEPPPDASFLERARVLHRRLFEDLDHRLVSGVRVLRELAKQAGDLNAGRMPVVFTSALALPGMESFTLAELGTIIHGISQTPQVWMDHQVIPAGDALAYSWDTVDELFPEGLMDAMFGAYSRFIEELADDPDAWQRPARIPLPVGQQEVRRQANATAGPVPLGLLHQPFLDQAARHGQRLAIVDEEGRLSYAELDRRSAALAARLHVRGERVAVILPKGWRQVVAVLGVLRAGGAYLPIEPSEPDARIEAMLTGAEVRTAITDAAHQPRLEQLEALPQGFQALVLDDGLPPAVERVPGDADPSRLAYVIHTSGSTGEPKGVMIRHSAALNTVVDVNERFAVGPEDRVLGLSSLSFDLSVYDLFGLLAVGGALVLPPSEALRDPGRWLELIERQRVSVWNTVPALMEMLVDYAGAMGRTLPASLRLVLLSGDWIPVGLPDAIRALASGPEPQVISLGGATEASIWSIFHPIDQVDARWSSIPYGLPLLNQTLYVFSPSLEPCPDHVAGELYIGGIGLADGYLGDPELTAERFIHHPVTGERLYRTGDLGRRSPDGVIEFLGRRDTQVKVRGYRIELGEIEAALHQHERVQQAVVVAVGAERSRRQLVAWLVLTAEGTEPASLDDAVTASIEELLGRRLPDYMVPTRLLALAELPLTANGKVDRSALAHHPQALAEAPEDRPERPAPPALVARTMELAAEFLETGSFTASTHLLRAGLNSVDLIRLMTRVERTFGVRPELQSLFRMPTIAGLASLVAQQTGVSTAGVASRSAWRTDTPLLDPEARERFKKQGLGVRPARPGEQVVALPRPVGSDAPQRAAAMHRRTERAYSAELVHLESVAELLACLRAHAEGDDYKLRYGSAGGSYAVQLWLVPKPDRVEGLAPHLHCYDPRQHLLVDTGTVGMVSADAHLPVNRAMFERSAFSLYLVAYRPAIAPLYGEQGRDFCLIEAGLMAQLLEQSAADLGLGLCQVGGLAVDPVAALPALSDEHELIHSLVGGAVGWEEGEL